MAGNLKLTASDGHTLDAYVASPAGSATAAIVVVQEIFGVNSHIRSVVDDFASQGFWTIAPALFDRVQPDVELTYAPENSKKGREMAAHIGFDNALKDVAAALDGAAQRFGKHKVGVVGYCYGGTLAWFSATHLDPAAAVCYYGGQIAAHAEEQPHCPVMLHFGAKDKHILESDIEKIRRAHPDLPIFTYDAGHGFNCDQRGEFDAKSSALARERTLKFLRSHLQEHH